MLADEIIGGSKSLNWLKIKVGLRKCGKTDILGINHVKTILVVAPNLAGSYTP